MEQRLMKVSHRFCPKERQSILLKLREQLIPEQRPPLHTEFNQLAYMAALVQLELI